MSCVCSSLCEIVRVLLATASQSRVEQLGVEAVESFIGDFRVIPQ